MKIELLPVIEINFYSEQIPSPKKGPYWEYEEEWEKFKLLCLEEAGISTKMEAVKKGSSLFRLNAIPKENLSKIIDKHFEELFGEEETVAEEIASLDGGYVLQVNGNQELFPQCCGTLKDIKEWENIYHGKEYFWIGHPFLCSQMDYVSDTFVTTLLLIPVPLERISFCKKGSKIVWMGE